MNFSEYTLISFGDSYTFGDGLVPIDKSNKKELSERYADNVRKTHQLTYTAHICRNLGFKDFINFGIPGGGNGHSIMHLMNFLEQTPNRKFFVLFNVTDPQRIETVKINPEGKNATLHNINYAGFVSDKGRNIADTIYSNFLTTETLIYNHVKFLYTLKTILKAYRCRYLVFDILNTVEKHIINEPRFRMRSGSYFDHNMKYQGVNYIDDVYNIYIDKLHEGEHIIDNYLNYNWFINNKSKKHKGRPVYNLDLATKAEYLSRIDPDRKLGSGEKYTKDEHNIWIRDCISKIDNGHWNELGHSVASGILGEAIESIYR